MIHEPTRDEMLDMVDAMNRYGGSFIIALAVCFIRADDDNRTRLYRAFPEYVKEYMDIMSTTPLRDLPAQWREQANDFVEMENYARADAFRDCAAELEAALKAQAEAWR